MLFQCIFAHYIYYNTPYSE